MGRATRNGLIAVVAASGAMAVVTPAHADAGAEGLAAGSPGVISGNTLQLPVHIPVNACGNTVNVVGLLNPAAGNTCVNEGADERGGHEGPHASSGGAAADGSAQGSRARCPATGCSCPSTSPST